MALATLAAPAAAQGSAELVLAGLVHELFTVDGDEVWAVEDGGRIRRRDPATGAWDFQATPIEAQDTIRKISAHQGHAAHHLWAAGQNGQVFLKTGAGPWTWYWQQPETDPSLNGPADLWDVVEVTPPSGPTDLYLLGLHGIWRIKDPHNSPIAPEAATFLDPLGQPMAPYKLELYSFDFAQGYALACGEPGLIFRQVSGSPDIWQQVFDIRDLCASPVNVLPVCAYDAVCVGQLSFEMWDLEISRNTDPNMKLAVAVGGIGAGCGVAFRSFDDGLTWEVESHECVCQWMNCTACVGNHEYKDDGNSDETWRLRKFNTLYDVGILHADNVAIACGYGGQIVVRDPADADPVLPGVQGVWRDRSSYSNHMLDTPSAVTMPQHAVATNNGVSGLGKAWVAGQGGYIRKSVDSGQTWEIVTQGANAEPGQVTANHWRVRDVHFANDQDGWMVAQFNVIERTRDGGTTWTRDNSDPQAGKSYLQAIAVDDQPRWGVAVGQPMTSQAAWPALVYTDDILPPFNAPAVWIEPQTVTSDPNASPASGQLYDVAWAGGNTFWAVGTLGLIYRTGQGGPMTWTQIVPDGESAQSFSNCDLDGVAFAGPSHGVFVGARAVGAARVGKAYAYDGTAPATLQWSEIPISDPDVVSVTDVDFDGATAYATGVRAVGAGREGVVLKSAYSSGSFGSFVVVLTVANCSVGEVPTAVEALTEVEIAPGGDVWVGGQCGRLWYSTNSGANWQPHRSASDAHVYGMSFASGPGGYVGYIAGHRASRTCHSIVKVTPQ